MSSSRVKSTTLLLVFIHESITFSKQPSSPETLSDPHLEELTIKADIGNTKLIISNIYIPPASSCSNGYQSSIEHLLTTPDTLILGDFNAHHPSWYSRSTDTRGKRMDDSISGSNYGILNWDSPTRVPPNAEPSSPDVSLASTSLITSCSWQTLSMLSSDHLPILIRLQMKTTSTRVYVEHIKLFADDSKLWAPVKTIEDCEALQNDITQLHEWADTWQLNFNEKKCTVLRVGKNSPS